ncbi:hypothetical protein HDU67_009627 [Dinochytrium kinnereticum]|nr:hypothetical protein HDU67_009627 [Dinochytrium kinnereticum]
MADNKRRTILNLDAATWHWKQRNTSIPLHQDISTPLHATHPGTSLSTLKTSWHACSTMPSTIHLELMETGVIPDPFEGTNEKQVQWVGEVDWIYRCEFEGQFVAGQVADLVCDGLDTNATVFLNGVEVMKADNMFIQHRSEITGCVKKTNTLTFLFSSSANIAKRLESEHGTRSVWNGDASRVYVRKAQYHWGWDWGPTLITCGPWKSVSIESYTSRISDVFADVDLNRSGVAVGGWSATVTVGVEVEGMKEEIEVQMALSPPGDVGGEIAALRKAVVKPDVGGKAFYTFSLQNPKLWWPVGLGSQAMYTVTTTIRNAKSGFVMDETATRFGIRKIQLIENDLPSTDKSKGNALIPKSTTFFFEVNGRPVFCGGSNWIPLDSFLTRRKDEQIYCNWLNLMVKGNQNMVRVWGGGIYESDHFYNLCDELGLLVWQDFMFACGSYPAHSSFRDQVRRESRSVLRRLRNHPCLAILTGNNEDYAFAESEGLGYEPECFDEDRWLKSGFPARIIYERDLVEVCREVCGKVPYKPGSPWGGRSSGDLLTGDAHQWNVWHGTQEPYQNYGKLAGRFVSEFGMQGYPIPETFHLFFPKGAPIERMNPVAAVVDHHNKATGFARRIGMYLFENLRYQGGDDTDGFISRNIFDRYATQLVQSEALSTAYRVWRRQWRGRGQEFVGGALVWQINDCWPCVSWAIVDYNLHPKPAYYTIKRELSPLTVGMERDGDKVSVWVCNSTSVAEDVTVTVKIFDIESGDMVAREAVFSVRSVENGVTEVGEIVDPSPTIPTVFSAVLTLPTPSTPIHSATLYPQPLRHLPYPLPNPDVNIETTTPWHDSETNLDHTVIRVTAARPVKGVWLYVEGKPAVAPGVVVKDSVSFDDNMCDLVPGVVWVVGVAGLKEHDVVRARWYGDWES